MVNSFDTSFIPQQPLLRVEGVQRERESLNIALVLSFVIFFVSLITAGGIYFYQKQIDARILTKTTELADIETKLDSAEIEKYKRVDSRIAVAGALLRDHKVFSVVLNFLEQQTARDIGLTALDYGINRDNKIEIRLRGVGPSFQSVYFQSETWKKATPFVVSMNIDRLSLDDLTGVVDFDATVVVNQELLKYDKFLEAEAAEALRVESEVNATTTTP